MALYQRGSLGSEVSRIQDRLKTLGFYRGPVDGIFGGGTEAAVMALQRAKKLEVDGKVGPMTWAKLFEGDEIPDPAIGTKPLLFRILALTGSFETGAPVPECFCGLSGDFDGQGISFGVLQWNLGQGSLQPMLADMLKTSPGVMRTVFNTGLPVLRAVLAESRPEQLQWARTLQDPRKHVAEPWAGMFRSLGRTPEFQAIEMRYATKLFNSAKALATKFDLHSERAVALMFDILTQNGGIGPVVEAMIRKDFAALDSGLAGDDLEVARMEIIANRRAAAANPLWIADVRARKLAIADGNGTVHGRQYDLAQMYGIDLSAA
jgi:peptidoglycan hydrolase-like protein with peptidoglycan-binding domain